MWFQYPANWIWCAARLYLRATAILQMNDLTNSSKLLFAILFADDTSVFLEGKEYTYLIEMLNSELKKLTIWLNANKLTVNVKKTHYMVFHRARIKTSDIEVVRQNKSINCVTSTKFLGIIIDNKLKSNQLSGTSILPMLKTKFPRLLVYYTKLEIS